MWGRIYALIIKECLAILRDKKGRMVLIIPPIVQLFVFSFAVTLDVKNVPIGILNRDSGRPSFELIQRFRGSPTFTKIITLNNVHEIAEVIDSEKPSSSFTLTNSSHATSNPEIQQKYKLS
jgi:ABC-2 type transport system permease protein